MDRARNGNRARTAGLVLMLFGAGWTQTGCIGGGGLRDGALAGPHWPRSRSRAEPGYDLYAQNMAESQGAKANAKTKPADNQALAANVEPVKREPRRPADEEVRVTLGRPESLKVLKEDAPAAASGAMLASAPSLPPALEPAPTLAPAPAPAPVRPRPKPAEPAGRVELSSSPAPEKPAPVPAEDPDQTLRRLLADARKRLETMPTYQVDIARVERVGSTLQPEEEAVLSIRRDPKAVRLEWPDGPSKGREVIYSAALDARMMHVNVANSTIPIPRMSLPVDSPLALRSSRHAITEAGFDAIFDNLNQQLPGPDNTPPPGGRLTYKGLQKPEKVDQTCHLIQRITPEKEIWRVYLDTESLMPVVVTAHQANGELLERYVYANLRANPTDLASAEAFDPDKRWVKSEGLLSRLARAAGSAAPAQAQAPAQAPAANASAGESATR